VKREWKREYKVGDRILIKLPPGSVSEGTIKAVFESSDGIKLQVAFGYDQTALIEEYQIFTEKE
jgi:hypothetical protein